MLIRGRGENGLLNDVWRGEYNVLTPPTITTKNPCQILLVLWCSLVRIKRNESCCSIHFLFMVEVIQSDFARLVRDQCRETEAQKQYDEFMADSSADKAQKTKDIEHKSSRSRTRSSPCRRRTPSWMALRRNSMLLWHITRS